MLPCFTSQAAHVIPIYVITVDDYPAWLQQQTANTQAWLNSFNNEGGALRLIPNQEGKVERVVISVAANNLFWGVAGLGLQLPEGCYAFEDSDHLVQYALSWGLGCYQFTKYKKPLRKPATLLITQPEILAQINLIVESIYLVRDLINTPTEDMGPSELAKAMQDLAQEFMAEFTEIVDVDLIKQNYAAIYTVGRASDDAPRLLDLRWGNAKHPKVTLVGKGVCFDSGGLDIKSSAGMLLMKKDMGGAAHVMGLARMIMATKLPIRLRVLVPAVENVISGNAYRPGDVIKSRKGLTIEVGNTDAEGRVVLADALFEAASENPELIIDMATLTGAARIAMGTDLPAAFSNDDNLINALTSAGTKVNDPMWRLPLYAPYRELLNSNIADINNNSSEHYGGAITAALFLKEFVPDEIPWVHFDLMAWNLRHRPGRPQGGEAMALRALFYYLSEKYSPA